MIERLERVTYGDDYARVPGLLNQVEGLRTDIAAVRGDVLSLSGDIAQVKAHKPQVWLWALGYVVFLLAGMFAMVAFAGLPEMRALLSMPAPLALSLALVFTVAAALLFAGGFGWLQRW